MAGKFRKVATILGRDGWLQGERGADGGPRCALGAIYGAQNSQYASADTSQLYTVACERFGNHNVLSLVTWNNDLGRTKEEVIAFFEDLAADLELRHQIKTRPSPIAEPVTA